MKNKKLAAIFMIAVLLVSVFVFAACEDPAVKVIYKDLNPKHETDDNAEKYITVGEAEIKPDMTLLELSKDGFVLEAWTTDQAGLNVFDPAGAYTQNVIVYAKWHKLPAMPVNLAYDADTHTISWSAVAGATGYLIQLDNNSEQLVVNTTYSLPDNILNGTHTFKVTAKENKYSSQTANLSFSVNREQPKQYVSFYVDEEIYRIVEIKDDCVVLPTAPVVSGYAFAGWTTDREGNEAFVNSNLEQSVSVYAQFKKLPQKVAPFYKPDTQRIEWTYTGNDAASFVVTFDGTETTINFAEGQSSYYFELPSGLTEKTSYTVEIVTVSVNEIGGEALKSEKAEFDFTYVVIREDTLTVTFFVDGEKYTTQVVSDGSVLLPQNPEKTGYVFDKWTTDEAGEKEFVPNGITESTTVYAQWKERPLAPSSVDFDAETATISWDAIDGIDEYWFKLDDSRNFTLASGTSFEVRSLSKGRHTVTFYTVAGGTPSEETPVYFDADVLYVWFRNTDGVLLDAAAVQEGSVTLPANPVKNDFAFAGWTVAAEYKSDSFVNSAIDSFVSVYAQFAALPEIGAYEVNGVNYVWTWNADSNANYYEVRFDSANALISRAAVAGGVATYSLNSTTIILTPGTHTLYVTAVDERGRKVELGQFAVDIVFDSEMEYIDSDGKLIRETIGDNPQNQTTYYIFFVGTTYRFSDYAFTDKTGEYYSVSGDSDNELTVLKATDSITIPTDKNVEINAKFVYSVSTFKVGDSIEAFKKNTSSDSVFLKKEGVYNVGVKSDFVLDTELISKGTTLKASSVEITYELESADGAPVSATDYFTMRVNEDGNYYLDWKPNVDLSSKTELILSLRPKYLTKDQNENASDYTAVFEFRLNDGVNVYDNAGLKQAFADVSVHTINIHGDIFAALDADQKNADGTAINYANYRSQPDGTKDGSVYYRVVKSSDSLTVNGNFFTVDASKTDEKGDMLVPRVYRRKASLSSDGNSGQAEPHGIAPYDVQNIQIALFVVYNDAASIAEADVKTTYNDLHIIGNSELKGGTEDEIAIYSGGHAGIMTRDSSAEINNVYAHNLNIAYYLSSSTMQRQIDIVDSYADQCWANSIYGHTTARVNIIGCDLRASSGAAIHLEDNGQDVSEGQNPELYIENTKINNWVRGDEAWFTAWGVSGVASALKTTAQSSIQNFGYSMLKKTNNVETLNFAVMMKPIDGDWSDKNNTSRFKYTFKDGDKVVSGTREYTWFSADPRVQSGSFLFPIGQYSPVEEFVKLLNGSTEQAAIGAAMLKAFAEGYELADGQRLCEIIQSGQALGGNVNSLMSLFVTYGQGEGWM